MPDYRRLGTMQGIATGLEKTTSNIMNIMIAREQLKEERKQSDLDFKIKKLKLQQMQYSSDYDPIVLDQQSKALKAEMSAKKAGALLAETVINNKLAQFKNQEKSLISSAQAVKDSIADDYTIDIGGFLPEGIKEKTDTEKYRGDLQRAKAGEISWDDVKAKYPEPAKQEQIEEIRKSTLPPVERAPGFKMGTGGLISKIKSFRSPMQAEINTTTSQVIQNIKNAEDLVELVKDRELYEVQDVDVDAILEYFGATKEGKIIDTIQIPGT